MSGQQHALAIIYPPPGKDPVPTVQEAGWIKIIKCVIIIIIIIIIIIYYYALKQSLFTKFAKNLFFKVMNEVGAVTEFKPRYSTFLTNLRFLFHIKCYIIKKPHIQRMDYYYIMANKSN